MCSFFSSVLGSSTLFNAVVSNVIITDTGPLSIRNLHAPGFTPVLMLLMLFSLCYSCVSAKASLYLFIQNLLHCFL